MKDSATADENDRFRRQILTMENGKGDVVKELADACHRTGMWFGLYLSAYDVHYQKSGLDKKAYNQYYETQLTELCTDYGVVDELWFDGAGANVMSINRKNISAFIQKYQPNVGLCMTHDHRHAGCLSALSGQ